RLVGGLFANGRILSGSQTEAVVVPTGAIRGEGAQTFVWAVQDGTVARRPVTLAERDDARGVVAVSSGLEGGEQVIVAPGQIEEGTRVRIGAAPPAPQQEG